MLQCGEVGKGDHGKQTDSGVASTGRQRPGRIVMTTSRTVATIVAVSACLLAAGASAQTAPAKPPQRNFTPYPAVVRENFMPACMKDGALSEGLCACVHRNLEREYTLAEYIEIDKAATENREHPSQPRVLEIAMACNANPNY
jgi:hypothetical protein